MCQFCSFHITSLATGLLWKETFTEGFPSGASPQLSGPFPDPEGLTFYSPSSLLVQMLIWSRQEGEEMIEEPEHRWYLERIWLMTMSKPSKPWFDHQMWSVWWVVKKWRNILNCSRLAASSELGHQNLPTVSNSNSYRNSEPWFLKHKANQIIGFDTSLAN